MRVYAGVFGLIGWFAIVGQYVVGHAGSLAGTVDYLSYFTILSNILVASTLSAAALVPGSGVGGFLLRPPVAMATAVYITVTGITYYFILSSLYHLEGWTKHFDHLLHYVMPPAYVLFWLVFVPKGRLHLTHVAWMLIPPLIYAGWTLVHGPLSGFWPYPFVDLPKLGWLRFLRNVAEFVVFFSLVGSVYVLADRLLARLRPQAAAPHGS